MLLTAAWRRVLVAGVVVAGMWAAVPVGDTVDAVNSAGAAAGAGGSTAGRGSGARRRRRFARCDPLGCDSTRRRAL